MRDPRDVMVSLYLHLQKRGFKTGLSFDGSLSEMIRDPRLGIENLINIQNHWLAEWCDGEGCLIWQYEDCRRDPEFSFTQVLRFLDDRPIDKVLLKESIAFAGFSNMKMMERNGTFNRPMLRPGDPADAESYKVRRGVVGGYVEYLTADDIRAIDQAASRLKRYGLADVA